MGFPLSEGGSFVGNEGIGGEMGADNPSITNTRRIVQDTQSMRYVTYAVDTLYPGMLATLREPMQIPAPVTVEIPRLRRSARVAYSLNVPVRLSWDQNKIATWTMNVSSLMANDIGQASLEMANKIRERRALTRRAVGFFAYAYGALFSDRQETIYLVHAPNANCATDNGSFLQTRQVTPISYDVFALSGL
jgi:hypothetical protein